MNNTISSASSPKIYTYNLEGQRVSVALESNPFDFDPQTLFSLAARKNKKRGFLFVSNVLGKHVPVDPFVPLLAGFALAVQFMSKIHNINHVHTQAIIQALKKNEDTRKVYESVITKSRFALPLETLFIGFAETATGLGHAVFSLFDNAYYLHTTREEIPLLPVELDFSEDHSHAVNHRCYPIDSELLRNPKTVVLVDDEITTGNTALNIIRAIHLKFPKTNYVVLSLLDWRTREERDNYKKLEQQLDIRIDTISLLEGEIEVSGQPFCEQMGQRDLVSETDFPFPEGFPLNQEQKFLNMQDVISVFSVDSRGNSSLSPYLRLTGRFGLSSREDREILPLAKRIAESLKCDRAGGKTLCLGTGEFIYLPMLISAYMGNGIRYHSTTRSPIYPFPKAQYGIQNGFAYNCPDNESITNYVYNLPLNYYDEVYLFLEREVSPEGLNSLLNVFHKIGIPRLVLVISSSRAIQDYFVKQQLA
ncbi:phosphoribosyltransferase family protein [Desulfosporosinus nitroreducens]|uniref:phosphoribosyltransferase family protein n=1 Tax=Desulfosporosinus nitroreducens TaxID=2018668 RepID=UPI00207CF168|nr:phosphoribosyltransferase family protein [Desulfosporosinus nitroreducens]MCO1601819.1 phosphoribosyltransferase family protein [Desulfosporosinus nitroreducens]